MSTFEQVKWGIQKAIVLCTRPPGNILLSFFRGLSSNELGISVSSPEIGGVSLNDSRSLSRLNEYISAWWADIKRLFWSSLRQCSSANILNTTTWVAEWSDALTETQGSAPGPHWTPLDPTGPHWTPLDPTGPQYFRSSHQIMQTWEETENIFLQHAVSDLSTYILKLRNYKIKEQLHQVLFLNHTLLSVKVKFDFASLTPFLFI